MYGSRASSAMYLAISGPQIERITQTKHYFSTRGLIGQAKEKGWRSVLDLLPTIACFFFFSSFSPSYEHEHEQQHPLYHIIFSTGMSCLQHLKEPQYAEIQKTYQTDVEQSSGRRSWRRWLPTMYIVLAILGCWGSFLAGIHIGSPETKHIRASPVPHSMLI